VRKPISSQTPSELRSWLSSQEEREYRADQILHWVQRSHAANWPEMTNLTELLQRKLSREFEFSTIKLICKQGGTDTTQKFLWKLRDGQLVESVLIPASESLYGTQSDRHTLCVSTQVGCAYGCKFCASGLDGFKRDLEPSEIIDQVLATERWHKNQSGVTERIVNNLVVMGMGEPLANYDKLMAALEILNADWGPNIGARKITISTSGLVPEIRRLAQQPQQYRLAISLHGATDEVRDQIMPVNKKYPLGELTAAIEEYQQAKTGKITLEYVLIAQLNDSLNQAKLLANLTKRLRAKVNLIPYNRVNGLKWKRPDEPTQDAFLLALIAHGTKVTLRREKGCDIDAACGQLRLLTEKELANVSS
jgi:23S rRNA (adenine2503-C2)-methyltransferase